VASEFLDRREAQKPRNHAGCHRGYPLKPTHEDVSRPSNLAHGLTMMVDACRQDGVERALLIASTMPNTVMDGDGHPVQSFPPSQENMAATRMAMDACAGVGLRVDTVTIAGSQTPRTG